MIAPGFKMCFIMAVKTHSVEIDGLYFRSDGIF